MNARRTPEGADAGRRRFLGLACGIGHNLPQEAPAILDAARA